MTYFDDRNPPKKFALARSKLLTHALKTLISAQGGSINFADFMEAALYHKAWGYYNNPNFTLGPLGDFTTAPELTPLFAGCFARQFHQIFQTLNSRTILEIGAGTGRFASDVLQQLASLNCLPDTYYIYEKSPILRLKQQLFLQRNAPFVYKRCKWLDTLPTSFSGIIIANEVLDALPVHRFQVETQQCFEQYVCWGEDQFEWLLKPSTSHQAQRICQSYGLLPGSRFELSLIMPEFVADLVKILQTGVIFFADYGYGEEAYYHPQRIQGTLTCFYQHQKFADPLQWPGLFDITAHVNFTQVIEAAADAGAMLSGFTTQAGFLLDCGLAELFSLATTHLPAAEQFEQHQAIKLLTLPTEMGERVKIMALSKGFTGSLIGYQTQDRTRDL